MIYTADEMHTFWWTTLPSGGAAADDLSVNADIINNDFQKPLEQSFSTGLSLATPPVQVFPGTLRYPEDP